MAHVLPNVFDIPEFLMLNYMLETANATYTLAELELYHHGETHEDPYVHGNKMQKEYCKWYFHKKSDDGQYNGGTFKGLDMTFGDGKAFTGVLIRSIVDTKTGTQIEGSCKVVNQILKDCGAASIQALVAEMTKTNPTLDIFTPTINGFRLVKTEKALEKKIYLSTRVGLPPHDTDAHKKYISMNYRYLDLANAKFKKNKKEIVRSLHLAGMTPAEIMALTSTRKGDFERWIDYSNATA